MRDGRNTFVINGSASEARFTSGDIGRALSLNLAKVSSLASAAIRVNTHAGIGASLVGTYSPGRSIVNKIDATKKLATRTRLDNRDTGDADIVDVMRMPCHH